MAEGDADAEPLPEALSVSAPAAPSEALGCSEALGDGEREGEAVGAAERVAAAEKVPVTDSGGSYVAATVGVGVVPSSMGSSSSTVRLATEMLPKKVVTLRSEGTRQGYSSTTVSELGKLMVDTTLDTKLVLVPLVPSVDTVKVTLEMPTARVVVVLHVAARRRAHAGPRAASARRVALGEATDAGQSVELIRLIMSLVEI